MTRKVWTNVRRKRSEAALLYQANLLQHISDAVIATDQELKITSWNQAAEDTYGWRLVEVIGRSTNEILQTQYQDPAQREQILAELQLQETWKGEVTQKHKDGSLRHIQASVSLIKDKTGKPVGVVTVNRDITGRRQTEEALRLSEERFAKAFRASPDGIAISRLADGRIIEVNERWTHLFGYSREEAIGQTADKLKLWLNQAQRQEVVSLIEQQGLVRELEVELCRKSGKLFQGSLSIEKIVIADELCVLSITRDITEHKRAAEALRLSEERFAKAFQASPDGIVITRLADGRIIEVNERWTTLFGFSREEALGRTTIELELYVRPEDRQRFRRLIETQGFAHDFEMDSRRKSGEAFQISLSAEVLSLNNEPCILTIIRDITERKQMEEALTEERNLLRTLIDNLPDNIYIKDAAGRHLLVNQVAVQDTGLTMEQMLGKTDLELYPLEVAEGWYADDMAVIQSGKPLINQEEPGVDEHGQAGWDLTTKVPFYDGHGQVIGLVGVTRDITEQKQAEEKLKQTLAELTHSNAELQQFAYVVSHDLQEPLRMVASYTQLLARRYKGKLDADADDFIAFAVDGAIRMQRLLSDLLLYSRVNTKGGSPRPTKSEGVLEDVLANLRLAITESQAIITHDYPLPIVLADETQLLQLFQNLIGNALKFRAEQSPEVHITAEARGNEWLFTVRDNGIGLEPQYAERIFVIFQRLHNREDYPGTGIGLAICKRIVERHGGRIWVESQPGQGTTFYFTLPAANNQPTS